MRQSSFFPTEVFNSCKQNLLECFTALHHQHYKIILCLDTDLKTVSDRLKSRYYIHKHIFVADMTRIFTNCRSYNDPDTEYYKCANVLEKFLHNKMREARLVDKWSLSSCCVSLHVASSSSRLSQFVLPFCVSFYRDAFRSGAKFSIALEWWREVKTEMKIEGRSPSQMFQKLRDCWVVHCSSRRRLAALVGTVKM